jgi:acetamidase/formamidase
MYTLDSTPENVHTFYDRGLTPLLTIDPGDAVHYRLLEAGSRLRRPESPGERSERLKPLRQGPDGHALCGPVAVRGAEPGMVLVVRVEKLRVGTWGQTFADGELAGGERRAHLWALDPDAGTGRNQFGHTVALRPFLGMLGVVPAEPGPHSTTPPRVTGGNIDCKELVVGSTIYLPVQVPGALFSTGDGHGLQGDGELSGTAIECPMEEALLTFDLETALLDTPWAETPAGLVTFGFDEDLARACRGAIDAMLDLMVARFQLHRADAVILASLLVDLRITQIVNGTLGVHAVLPWEAADTYTLRPT